ncbi:hypothetical protein E2C01_050818 [Portunus trituberculatus]|uniref:Uncharacterized protein n=1 Tax=Portunus trituberculatus TaxID=210409 RepID=A0A5B7GHH6_PORTR|nr:hypothetical protein [Portunus trituberculatus]
MSRGGRRAAPRRCQTREVFFLEVAQGHAASGGSSSGKRARKPRGRGWPLCESNSAECKATNILNRAEFGCRAHQMQRVHHREELRSGPPVGVAPVTPSLRLD